MDKLSQLAIKYGTDKFKEGCHHYTPIYNQYFQFRRKDKLRILEIGYGGWSEKNGYNEPDLGGESARMWRDYFPNSEIIVVDIVKKNVKDTGYSFRQGSQTDDNFLHSLGWFDIIIDDGSHRSEDQIHTFETMFHQLNKGGIYVIEDTQTSYWPELSPTVKATEYFKTLTDGLNYNEIRRKGCVPTYFDEWIFSIHFYHNLIFIIKGDNTEPSNSVKND
jgi:hypothetical protein